MSAVGVDVDAESFGFVEGGSAHDFAGAAVEEVGELHDGLVFCRGHFYEEGFRFGLSGRQGWAAAAGFVGHGVVFVLGAGVRGPCRAVVISDVRVGWIVRYGLARLPAGS